MTASGLDREMFTCAWLKQNFADAKMEGSPRDNDRYILQNVSAIFCLKKCVCGRTSTYQYFCVCVCGVLCDRCVDLSGWTVGRYMDYLAQPKENRKPPRYKKIYFFSPLSSHLPPISILFSYFLSPLIHHTCTDRLYGKDMPCPDEWKVACEQKLHPYFVCQGPFDLIADTLVHQFVKLFTNIIKPIFYQK